MATNTTVGVTYRVYDRSQSGTASFLRSIRQTQRAVLGLAGAYLGGRGILGTLRSFSDAAMAAQESENLFNVSMGQTAGQARQWSKTLAAAIGANDYAIRRNVATFNVMFTSMGTGTEKAYEMAAGLTQLAYDMASFYNLKPEEAFQKLQAGITGETEPLKRLGILVNETAVKNYALTQGWIAQGQELSQVGKVYARYNLIAEQTRKAQGDLVRTADSATNVMRSAKEQWDQTRIALGQALLPTITKVGKALRDMLRSDEFIPRVEQAVNAVKNVAVVGAGLYVFSKGAGFIEAAARALAGLTASAAGLAGTNIVANASSLATAAKALALNLAAVAAPAALLVGSVAAIGLGVYSLATAWRQNFADIRGYTQDLLNAVKSGFEWLQNSVFGQFAQAFVDLFVDAFKYLRSGLVDFVTDVTGAARGAASWLKNVKDGVVSAWTNPDIKGAIADVRRAFTQANEEWAKSFVEGKDTANKALDDLRAYTVKTFEVLDTELSGLADPTAQAFSELWQANVEQARMDLSGLFTWLEEKVPWLAALFKPIKLTVDVSEAADAAADVAAAQQAVMAAIRPGGNVTGAPGSGARATVDVAAATARMYEQIEKMDETAYRARKVLLDKQYEDYLSLNIDKLAVDKWYKDQSTRLEIERLKAAGDLASGVKAAALESARQLKTLGEMGYEAFDHVNDAVVTWLDNIEKGREAVRQLGLDILSALRHQASQQISQQFLMPLIGSVVSGVGGWLSGTGTASNPTYTTSPGQTDISTTTAYGGKWASMASIGKQPSAGMPMTVQVINPPGTPLRASVETDLDKMVMKIIMSHADDNSEFSRRLSGRKVR
jgi:hypothetical protein